MELFYIKVSKLYLTLALSKKCLKHDNYVVGYEATYLGYTLARDLKEKNIACKVIAPTSIKHAINDRVKNDRLDSLRLAEGMQRKDFNYIAVPTMKQESDRQLGPVDLTS